MYLNDFPISCSCPFRGGFFSEYGSKMEIQATRQQIWITLHYEPSKFEVNSQLSVNLPFTDDVHIFRTSQFQVRLPGGTSFDMLTATQSPWDDIPYSVDPQGGENHDVSWEFHGLLKVFPHRKKWTTSWTWNFRGFPTVDFTEKNNEYPNTILRLSHSTCEARESPAGLEPAAASDHVHSFSLWRSHLGSILTPNILVWFKLLLFVWVWKRLLPKVFGDGNEETGVSEVNTIPCLYICVCVAS